MIPTTYHYKKLLLSTSLLEGCLGFLEGLKLKYHLDLFVNIFHFLNGYQKTYLRHLIRVGNDFKGEFFFFFSKEEIKIIFVSFNKSVNIGFITIFRKMNICERSEDVVIFFLSVCPQKLNIFYAFEYINI